MKKLLKMSAVLFLSSLVIIFNIWYFIICAFTPEYYQNTNLTSDEKIRFEKLYHIDFPDETKFIKAREYLAGPGGDTSAVLYVSLPTKRVEKILSDYTYMKINYTDNVGSMYGVDVSKSVGGSTTLTFGTYDKKGTFFNLKHDNDWMFKGTDWNHYFWTAASINALIYVFVLVIGKQMNKILN
ncbi:hypothetical protein FO507_08800 [Bacillus mojavensis]|uniref:hypothetical protein n=1 Tax=Bacillus TaxID=1386 RepID=UPI000287A42D|nr:hypothetical protein [Bacillus mojavensis]MDR4227465.1 hypothetical protein [Bacillus mojavensis]MEC1755332.1 hypothetical protein [Bacillus mojavensis]MEC3588124.1 hypothetical protein [Bacillus mojavensis]MEC5243907.1 hypothetical protein [Bacillus mojavensis]MED0750165.1 hypothetical protein [Bacillus mojavensis]